jgi:signal peptidase II
LKKSLLVVFLVLLIDQSFKFWIKTHLYLGEEIRIAGQWFILHFTENPGMAFGMEIGGSYGKLFLSLFRILAVIGIIWYLSDLIKKKAPSGLIISMSLILAGALGNIIDSVFYGVLFSDSSMELGKFLPAGGGYAGFLHGRVVDMLYFPIIDGYFPTWFPIYGGESFIFFRPVFNIADSSISIGVALILLFQSSYFSKNEKKQEAEDVQPQHEH